MNQELMRSLFDSNSRVIPLSESFRQNSPTNASSPRALKVETAVNEDTVAFDNNPNPQTEVVPGQAPQNTSVPAPSTERVGEVSPSQLQLVPVDESKLQVVPFDESKLQLVPVGVAQEQVSSRQNINTEAMDCEDVSVNQAN